MDICEAFDAFRWCEWLRALFQKESVGMAKLYCGKRIPLYLKTICMRRLKGKRNRKVRTPGQNAKRLRRCMATGSYGEAREEQDVRKRENDISFNIFFQSHK